LNLNFFFATCQILDVTRVKKN